MMIPARFQSATADSKPKPRSTNHSSRSLPMSKSSCVTMPAMPKADHSKSPSSFSDHTRFFCSTCNKCVFNANHDACITKLLKEVNSRTEIQSHKTRDRNKPVDQKSHTQIPGRNPSQPVRTRRQLESDAEMCMFALIVSRTEPKNIKEAMADSAWIESMQEEL
nr:Gag-Pol polyprotein [Tanacetum cinerariifolium]